VQSKFLSEQIDTGVSSSKINVKPGSLSTMLLFVLHFSVIKSKKIICFQSFEEASIRAPVRAPHVLVHGCKPGLKPRILAAWAGKRDVCVRTDACMPL
jgi:hypothetical protein